MSFRLYKLYQILLSYNFENFYKSPKYIFNMLTDQSYSKQTLISSLEELNKQYIELTLHPEGFHFTDGGLDKRTQNLFLGANLISQFVENTFYPNYTIDILGSSFNNYASFIGDLKCLSDEALESGSIFSLGVLLLNKSLTDSEPNTLELFIESAKSDFMNYQN